MKTTVQKLYLSNFLVGLVFWYGIEKLFLSSIGINPAQIGIAAASLATFTLIFDIPSGLLADKWSRKKTLILAFIALACSSLFIGLGSSFTTFFIGYMFYGVYLVCTSGTYAALMYDALHEEGRSDQYSKINGRAYAMVLVGAGVANIFSGFIAHSFGFRVPFVISVVPAILNVMLMMTITEPTFHKAEHREKIIKDAAVVAKSFIKVPLLRAIVGVLTGFTFVELFKTDFSQLLMLRYTSSAQAVGILWAIYAFAWGLGGLIAHKVKNRMSLLLFIAGLSTLMVALIDSFWALAIFMVQSVAYAAFINLAETQIQHATPSRVRASVMSIVGSLGRMVAIPGGVLLGWLIEEHGIRSAVWSVAIVAVVVTLVWFVAPKRTVEKNI